MREGIARLLQALERRAAHAYVAGAGLPDAVRGCRFFESRGLRTTICYWSGLEDSPQAAAEQYLAVVDAIRGAGLQCYASVKAPALGFSRDLFERLAERARARDVGLHFDSLGPEDADRTFALIGDLVAIHRGIGCTLPGRWRRSIEDADRAAALGLRVRVVKGQWAEPAHPARDPRAGFLEVVDRLAGRARHVAVATHDPALASEALSRLRRAGTPCELEFWLGLPVGRALLSSARALGVPVRMYVAYGQRALPYRMWHVKRDPRVAGWAFRDLYTAARARASRSTTVAVRYGFLKPP